MTLEDLHIFCTALGFTAVVVGGSGDAENDAQRALGFASLIENFCKFAIPGLGATAAADVCSLDKIIEEIKVDLSAKGEADMDRGRASLLLLYQRLVQRYADYATDDMVADRVLELIDMELDLKPRSGGQK